MSKHFGGYSRTFTSYSGADMVASITVPGQGPVVFGELRSISYSVYREKYPVRALGRVSMKGYTRGMRTISGIMSFMVFDETIVYRCMEAIRDQGYKILMDELPMFDVTISSMNEFGDKSRLTIYGISTYMEGQAMTIDQIYTENAFQFYALDIDPLTRVE
ncbi:hypothetical protein [Alicyclobacillus shizuokensis]|uniref:hypothetical protein n=1 Tax=Alicyclobacillus shizuokensis TaxID=392014 RepID=UPI0008372AE6|nr:hypothetical protein [Alicyclobacillus shizuokensis]